MRRLADRRSVMSSAVAETLSKVIGKDPQSIDETRCVTSMHIGSIGPTGEAGQTSVNQGFRITESELEQSPTCELSARIHGERTPSYDEAVASENPPKKPRPQAELRLANYYCCCVLIPSSRQNGARARGPDTVPRGSVSERSLEKLSRSRKISEWGDRGRSGEVAG